MAVSREQLKTWIGDGYRIRTEQVDTTDWNKQAWRAEYLCKRARLSSSFVYSAPGAGGKRVVFFAAKKLT